jgi:hypothetical protein
MAESRHEEVDRFTHRRRRHARADDQVTVEDLGHRWELLAVLHGCGLLTVATGTRTDAGFESPIARPTRTAVSSPTHMTTLASAMAANVVRESVPAVTPWIVANAKSGKLA